MIRIATAARIGAAIKIPEYWALTVVTTAVNQDYTVDINAGITPNIKIDWGDGNVETFNTIGLKTKVYANAGTYVIKLSGSFASGGNIRFGSNIDNRARLKSTSPAPYIPGLLNFKETFNGCTGLTGSIPADLFRYNINVSTEGFRFTFQSCTGLTGSIPADLFRYNTLVSTSGFFQTFTSCTGLTGSIPADLFRYNTLVSTNGFNSTFYGCNKLTGSIPADLFRYNTLVSTFGFYRTFFGCTELTGSIPADLFRYNTLVSTNGFNATFRSCTGLTGSIPADLFRYNINVSTSGFYQTFNGCRKLELSPWIFFAEGEEGTRFLNRPSDFQECFMFSGAYGGSVAGTAPALWNCNFGTATPVTTDTFQGHSAASLTNWADIPAAWT